ncbi:MAG: DUF1727 domain-containing protein [Peptococcaceae bacterium]|nr:DUF1727 domain-containing protein [Peptococcaceae bacterium]
MKKIRLITALILGKLALLMIKLLGKGKGTSLPGRLALKISSEIIRLGALRVKKGIILVTGTNGKTTTNNMIASVLEESGYRVLINREGANLVYGIATVFVREMDIWGNRSFDYACLEIDEAAFPVVLSQVDAGCVVITNFFRDQLDRFGELDKTVGIVANALKNYKKTRLVLNGDDPLVAQLGRTTGQSSIYYGLEKYLDSHFVPSSVSEGKFCPLCGQKLDYSYYQYSQLGSYSCTGCGFSRLKPDIEGISPQFKSYSTSCLIEYSSSERIKLDVPIYGIYNLYNTLAAFATLNFLQINAQKIVDTLGKFKPATGRMEIFKYQDKSIFLHLVKNPTGFNQGLKAVLAMSENPLDLMIAINDNDADGRDISWLWDVDFEILEECQERFLSIVCSGIRAEEIALRLKYAGIRSSKLLIIKDYNCAVEMMFEGKGGGAYILATYTALWPVERIISQNAQRI